MKEVIKENPDYVKVDKTYIVNTNHEKWKKVKMRNAKLKEQEMIREDVANMKTEVDQIKTQMCDINSKLDSIVELMTNTKE